jgi:hypothetical protein
MTRFILGILVGSLLTTVLALAQVRMYGDEPMRYNFDGLNSGQRYEQQQLNLQRERNQILRQQQFNRQPC